MAEPAGNEAKLLRELAYYKRELNEAGGKLVRAREEQHSLHLEAQRSKSIAKMMREVFQTATFARSETGFTNDVLTIITQVFSADRVMFLRETPPGSLRLTVIQGVGLPKGHSTILEIRRHIPQFLFTASRVEPDYPATAVASFIGLPYVLWTYDDNSRMALLVGTARETNVGRPFEAEDLEVIETALSVYLDGLGRIGGVEHAAGATVSSIRKVTAEPTALLGPGVTEAELERFITENGSRILSALIVERKTFTGWLYVPYLEVSWSHGYRVLRTTRDQADKDYHDCNRIIRLLRDTYQLEKPIAILPYDSRDLPRPVRKRELELIGETEESVDAEPLPVRAEPKALARKSRS